MKFMASVYVEPRDNIIDVNIEKLIYATHIYVMVKYGNGGNIKKRVGRNPYKHMYKK